MSKLNRLSHHEYCVLPIRRAHHNNARNITKYGEGIVIVKMSAKAFLVGQTGNTNDHTVVVLTIREKGQSCGFAPNLVFGIMYVSQELNFRYGKKTLLCHAHG